MRTSAPTIESGDAGERGAERVSTPTAPRRIPSWAIWLGSTGAAIAVVAALVWTGTPPDTSRAELYEGRKLPRETAQRIVTALEAVHIHARLEPSGAVSLPRSRRAEALALLARQKLGPRDLAELRAEFAKQSSFLEGGEDREARLLREREAVLASLLLGLPEVASADVLLSEASPNSRRPHARELRGAVWIEPVERQRPLDETTIDAICAQLTAAVPELARDGISIFDQAGRTYLAPGYSAAVSRTRGEAFANQTERQIVQQLRWIEGLRVLVTTEARPGAEVQGPSIALNQAVEPGPGGATDEAARDWRARVIIQVPTSYYMRGYRTFVGDRDPTEAELEPYIELTEGRIRHIVEGIVPAAVLESLVIERMDEVGREARVAVSLPHARGFSVRWPAWTPVAVSWAVIALAMLGVLTRAGVRIATQGTKGDAGGVIAKPPRMAESMERVNRLVRERPEVAAAILERWAQRGVVSS